MKSLTLSLLIPAILATDYGPQTQLSPCECFDVKLAYGFPDMIDGEICYKYQVTKKRSNMECPQDLDYFIISSYVIHCSLHLCKMDRIP